VRIVAGRHRGRRLHFVPGRGLRPTPDRVRETLFNWLQAEIRGARCLDLFAGSGALGLEALSRGAGALYAVEQNRVAAQRLRENIELLGEDSVTTVIQTDALRLLKSPPDAPFDIVFLDPPFADGLLPAVSAQLEQHGWLASDATIYLEQDSQHPWSAVPANWTLHREGFAGQSKQRLLRRSIPR
jgi:16S rRNA (guanine966-N2)-methyltransferase